jgi:hypothetical protein
MTPQAPILLLCVAAVWSLPGLGLLALPNGHTSYLATCDLHSPLSVIVQRPDGSRQPGMATVEEVSRPNDNSAPMRGLLLDLGTVHDLPVGTIIWLQLSALNNW